MNLIKGKSETHKFKTKSVRRQTCVMTRPPQFYLHEDIDAHNNSENNIDNFVKDFQIFDELGDARENYNSHMERLTEV